MLNNDDSPLIKKLSFQTSPTIPLSFRIDAEAGSKIKITGNENGTILIEGNFITYTSKKDFFGVELLSCEVLNGNIKSIILVTISVGYAFKAKSHILSLLGDELIGSDNLAIFELVKNSYDADAESVTISLNDLNTSAQSIVIEDDGNGMTPETLINVWLEIGTDFKRGVKREPSAKFERVSLGEKGVGRLAVHKLGRKIILETQSAGSLSSSRITINWPQLIGESEYIQDTNIEMERLDYSLFPLKGQGTRIIVSELKKETWTRRDLRELARKTLSIINPFQIINSFIVSIKANDYHNSWFEDIKDPKEILDEALYYFEFTINSQSEIQWNYVFNPPHNFDVPLRSVTSDLNENKLRINDKDELFLENQKHLNEVDLVGIGPIKGRFYVYNLLAPILNAFGQTNAIKSFVKENSGIRVFRDGIRIYNYGEPGDDWLGLDLARVQKLGERFSKNTVIGAIEIEMASSHDGLVEKTNREGFDDNVFFKRFKFICNEVFDFFQRLAISDREKIKNYLEDIKPTRRIGFSETLEELNAKIVEKKLEKELSPLIKRVQKDYNDMRDVMVNSGMAGLNLGIIFHEVDREVRFINTDLDNNIELESIKIKVKNLIQLLENISPLLKQNQNISIHASKLSLRAKDINLVRFDYHKIIFSSPLISGESEDFLIKGPGNLLLSAVSNLIDNSIYWLTCRQELESKVYKSGIYITSDMTNFSGPAIIVADNGTGFKMDPEDLVFPFRTTRPGGMGLGLYFVNIVMEMVGGKLLFPDRNEIGIPENYDGAVVALVFPK